MTRKGGQCGANSAGRATCFVGKTDWPPGSRHPVHERAYRTCYALLGAALLAALSACSLPDGWRGRWEQWRSADDELQVLKAAPRVRGRFLCTVDSIASVNSQQAI